MSISIDELKKIGQLARIKLTPGEEKRYAETISVVLDYMKVLNEVDTAGIEQTYQVTGLADIVRNDEPRVSSITKELLAQLPQVENNELVVPAVFATTEEL